MTVSILSYERPSALTAVCVPVLAVARPPSAASSAHAMNVGVPAVLWRLADKATQQSATFAAHAAGDVRGISPRGRPV